MPDASIVESQFVREIAKILTSSSYQPYAVGMCDALNQPFRLMRGWPVDQQLVKDLAANPPITNITVFSQPGQRNTTRFLRQHMHQPVRVPAPTMFASIAGNAVTFEGLASDIEVMSVAYGNSAGVAMRLSSTDTPASIATYFAGQFPGASATGPVLTLNTYKRVSVALGMDVNVLSEVHRQCGIWRVTFWTATVGLRDQFCSLVDPNLQGLDRFFFDDGSCSGPVIGAGFMVDDVVEKQNLWKRDLLYELEYPTDTAQVVPVMVLGHGTLNDHSFFTGIESSDVVDVVGGADSSGITGSV